MDGLIQVVILICLIVVIILLLVDKIKIIGAHHKLEEMKEKTLPDVIGKVSVPQEENTPVWLANRKKFVEQLVANNVRQLPIESVERSDKEEKKSENDIMHHDDDNVPPNDDRFGQAVSLNELTKVGNLLQQDNLDLSQEKETADIIQKIEGTEFFTMMQQSIEGASEKIARLLDKSLLEKHTNIPKENQNNVLDNFDIGDFI